MKKPSFVNDAIYHVYNRGVEKRDVFTNNSDRFRFIHDLFEFNDQAPAQNLYYKQPTLKSYEVQPHKEETKPRKLLVEILAFCLMPNHYHLLLKQKIDGGIIDFMQKLGTGYTMYFNKKYERVGSLFQGRFKAILVNNEAHFIFLPHYIHLNPLDLIMPQWRERKIKDYKKAIDFLENYRWSSYRDYIGLKNFPSITSRDFLLAIFNGSAGYKNSLRNWLKELNLSILKEEILE